MKWIAPLIAMNLLIGSTDTALADEGVILQDAVKRFAESRRKITTYAVSVTADVDDAAEPVRLSNGETYIPKEKLVAFTLEVVANVSDGRILVARLDRFENIESGESENRTWQVWVTQPRRGSGESFGSGRLLSGGTKPEFFDPLAIGLGLGGEYSRGDPLAKIVKAYLSWPRWKSERSGMGRLRFGSKQAVYLEFDPNKDYSPTELHSKQGNSTPFEVRLGLSKVDGHWLPTTGDVVTGDQKQTLTFTWHSVNESVDSRFSPEDIANRYQIEEPRGF